MTVVQFPGSSIDISEVHERFTAAMRQRDLLPPHEILADGKFHRCDVGGKRGKNDGSYILFPTGKIPAGGFQNFKDGLGWQNWHYDLGRSMLTPAERREIEAKQAAIARDRADQEKIDAAAAADRAQRIWSRARAPGDHEYLKRKNVGACGTRSVHTALVVPARTVDGELRGLQFITADGKKSWMKGSRPSGAFHQIGEGLEGDVVICEGFATGATIYAATGKTTLVAFACNNLRPVAEALQRRYPSTKIIIAADDDRETKGNPEFTLPWMRRWR
jgi:putative DNA primase/helicase